MKRLMTVLAIFGISISPLFAQSGGPTYKGDPDAYKLVFEDKNFNVITATWPVGTTDKPHTHPLPSLIYFLTDCTQVLKTADGKTIEVNGKAGTAREIAVVTQPHTATNTGSTDCKVVIVEKK